MKVFNKEKNGKQIVCLSDKCVEFIKKYLITEMSITKPIDENTLSDIESVCFDYDDMLASKELDPNLNIDEEKCKIACDLVGEIYSALEYNMVDYDDLNKRLGLKWSNK